MIIYLSELGLVIINWIMDIYIFMFDFLSTVHGDYDRGGIEIVLFVYENVKYRIASLLSNLFY